MGEDFYRKIGPSFTRTLQQAIREHLVPLPLLNSDSEEELTTYPCSLRKNQPPPNIGEHLFLFRPPDDGRVAVLRKNVPIGEVLREAAQELLSIMPPGGIIEVWVVSVSTDTNYFEVAVVPVREPVHK